MTTTIDLHELSRDLADEKVLSVYLDTSLHDPALRFTGRLALAAALRTARAQIHDADDRAQFDRAALAIYQELPPADELWSAPGWVAFVTSDGVRHVGWLPVRPTSFAAWRDGPVIAPYLRALKQQRPVAVALVDSRSARLYQYVGGALDPIETLAPSFEEALGGDRTAASPGAGRSVPAPRGALATEAAARRRRTAFQRLASVLTVRLGEIAGPDGWILIGGTPAWSRIAGEALPAHLQQRMLVSPSLGHAAADEEIAREARQAATTLRSAQGRRLLAEVLESAGAHGRATIGMRSVQRALALHAVEMLLLSPDFIADAPIDAELAVRAAIAGGATIEVLSGEAAEHLDQAANGIGARLRFAVDKVPYKDYPSRENNDATLQAGFHREGTRAGSFTETDLAVRDRRVTRA